ncbi:hypothetical protein AMATHDRAFT_160163, partial [Amanita thiersii Skay4041]
DKDVIHVDAHPSFSYFVPEDVVHHSLEQHDKWFKKSPIGPKCGLPFVSLLDPDIIVAPTDIHF